MWNAGMSQFLPFIITILLILFKDLLWGVSIGLVVAVFEILYINYKKPYQINIEDDKEGQVHHILLTENVTFLNKASIMNTLDNIPDGTKAIVDASRTTYIHPDVEEIIEDFKTHASFSNITLEVIK